MGIRILFIGENWHGSNATSCKRAFRALGCDVLDVDEWHFYPQWESLKLKVIRRALRRIIVNEFCNHLEKQFRRFHPHLVFIFKGAMVTSSTLQFFKQQQMITFNFYPDVDLVRHHSDP
jgi:hypothetical protein